MNEGGDKLVTNVGSDSAIRSKTMRSRGRKKQGPFLKVKAGSAVVPIYQTESKGRVRYTLSFYRDERRMRKVFTNLECAKREALFVAQRISWRVHADVGMSTDRDGVGVVTSLNNRGLIRRGVVWSRMRRLDSRISEEHAMRLIHPIAGDTPLHEHIVVFLKTRLSGD